MVAWIIAWLFIKSISILFAASLALWFSILIYRKKFNWIRFLKPYVYLILGILLLNPTIALLPEAINREQDPRKLIHPYSEQVCKIRAEIFPNKKNYTIDDIWTVVNYVFARINYSFDWFNWGLYEYFPTADETIERESEDCDGRAILCCSILRSMNLNAWVVFGVDHAWVRVITENSFEDLMGPRPPEFYMFNEERIVYFMTDIEMLYNKAFPAYAYITPIISIVLIFGNYMTLFVAVLPEEYKKGEGTIEWLKRLKKSGYFKPSKYAWMLVISSLTILSFSLISIKIPQAFYLSLIGLASIGLTTVYRMKKEATQNLYFVLLFLVIILLAIDEIQEANTMLNINATQFL